MLKKFTLIILLAVVYSTFVSSIIYAQQPGAGNQQQPGSANQPQPGTTNQQQPGSQNLPNPFGTVTNPLPAYQSTSPGGGLIILLNNVLRLIFVGAGIFAFIRFILAGLKFISSSGDPKGIEAAWNAIWQSLLGLVIIISSFAIAALIGQLLFGDATTILNPRIYGP